jgi:hypothetical protein
VTTFGFVNNFSKTFTKHIVRFGMEIRRERNDLLQTQTFNPRGLFQYEPAQTGDSANTARSFANAFAAFLLDTPNNSGRDLPLVFPARRELIWNYYIQDKWQVTSKLTIDLGLRLERERGSRPRYAGGFSNYNYFNNTLELAGVGAIPINITDANNNFGPRLGIAYRLNEQTVIRTGYGISYFPRRMAQTNFPILQNSERVRFKRGDDGHRVPSIYAVRVAAGRNHHESEPDEFVRQYASKLCESLRPKLELRGAAGAALEALARPGVCRQPWSKQPVRLQHQCVAHTRDGQRRQAPQSIVPADSRHDDVHWHKHVVQLVPDEARPPFWRRPLPDDLVHIQQGSQLQRRQRRRRDTFEYPVEQGAYGRQPHARLYAELHV